MLCYYEKTYTKQTRVGKKSLGQLKPHGFFSGFNHQQKPIGRKSPPWKKWCFRLKKVLNYNFFLKRLYITQPKK